MTNSATAVKSGVMVSTGSILTDLVIFNDHAYVYLAIVGAIVSMFGVVHEVFGSHSREYSKSEIVVEIIKGIALGVLAIPFWYICISDGVIGSIAGIDVPGVSSSLAMIVSFALSWYTVPIFDWLSGFVRKRYKNVN